MDEIQDRPQYCIEEIKELESRAKDFMDTLDEAVAYAIKKAKGADDLAQAFEYLSELTYTVLLTMNDALAHANVFGSDQERKIPEKMPK